MLLKIYLYLLKQNLININFVHFHLFPVFKQKITILLSSLNVFCIGNESLTIN
jgi:hypothetical protein